MRGVWGGGGASKPGRARVDAPAGPPALPQVAQGPTVQPRRRLPAPPRRRTASRPRRRRRDAALTSWLLRAVNRPARNTGGGRRAEGRRWQTEPALAWRS